MSKFDDAPVAEAELHGPRPRRRGRPPAGESRRTRDEILRAARELFGEYGYERTNLREVAVIAGVTRPAINYYFASKQALYEAVFDVSKERVVVAGVSAAQEVPSARRRIGAFLHAASAIDSTDRSFARFIASSLLDAVRNPELGDAARRQLDEVRSFVRSALEDGTASGEIRRDLDVAATTEMLLAAIWGIGLYAAFIGSHEQLEKVVEQFGTLIEGTLF